MKMFNFCYSVILFISVSFYGLFSMDHANFFRDPEVCAIVENVSEQLTNECWKVLDKASIQDWSRKFEGLGCFFEGSDAQNPPRTYESLIKDCLRSAFKSRLGDVNIAGSLDVASRLLAQDFFNDYERKLNTYTRRTRDKVFTDLCQFARDNAPAATPFLNFLISEEQIEIRHEQADGIEVERPVLITNEIQKNLEDEIRLKLDSFIRWIRAVYEEKSQQNNGWAKRQFKKLTSREYWKYLHYFSWWKAKKYLWNTAKYSTATSRYASYFAPAVAGGAGYLIGGPAGSVFGTSLGGAFWGKRVIAGSTPKQLLQAQQKCERYKKIAEKRGLN